MKSSTLKIFRTLAELSQVELAKKSQLKQWQVSLFETGQALPNPQDALKIAKVLGVNSVSLIWPELQRSKNWHN